MAKIRATGHTWQELEDQCTELARVVNDALQRVIDRAVTRLSRGLTAAGESPDDVGGVAGDWDAEVRSTIAPYIVASYEGGALELAHNLVDQLELEPGQGIPGVSNALSEQYLSERRNLLRGVGDDLYGRMRTSLLEGMNKGESTEKLAQRVKDIGSFTQGRANAVARTEVLSASNRGSYDQAQLVLNDGDGKEWLATEDGRTRFDHAEADHQIVPVNASFVVGGYHMMHPGDDTAPAGEVVNCRCTIAYVFEDEMPPRNTCNGLGAVTAAVMNTGTCITKPEFHSSEVEVPPMTPAQERALYDDFKSRGAISPAYGGARIYKHLQDMQDQTLDEFQRLKVVDKVYAQDGGKSSFLDKFEEWAKSSVGKKTTGGLERGTYSKPVVPPETVLTRAPEPVKLEPESVPVPVPTTAQAEAHALNLVEGSGRTQVDRVLSEQSALIPKTLSNLQGIRKMDANEAKVFAAQHGKDALGGYTVERQDITIHPQVMTESYARQFAKESKNGFLSHTGHDHDAVESFVAHELGHHVDNVMRMATPQDVAAVWKVVGQSLGVKPPLFTDRHSLNKWVEKNHDLIAKNISRYGAEDSAELLAEVWAEYTTNVHARPHIKQIGEAMQSLAERVAPSRVSRTEPVPPIVVETKESASVGGRERTTGRLAREGGALRAAPLRIETASDEKTNIPKTGIEGFSRTELFAALDDYAGADYKPINSNLRRFSGNAEKAPKKVRAQIERIDVAMRHSQLTSDVIVYRGTKNPTRMFGDAWASSESVVGMEWVDDGYTSTTAGASLKEKFVVKKHGTDIVPVVMNIRVPAGTQAVQLSPMDDEGELLLHRGAKFRVVKDRGVTEARGMVVRELDIEVIE